ncbi:MAG: SDR family oxidoreductase [Acidimicrobiales bacterium]|nr:SDR family oxidoreductase [Acidimicrobiales bacterium]
MTTPANSSGPLDLTGRRALVTGGTKGLGRAIAETFLAHGATVTVAARNEPEALPTAGDNTARFVAADVRDAESVAAMTAAAAEPDDRLDILVNNAGGGPPADSATVSHRFNDKILGLNLHGPILCAQAAYPYLTTAAAGATTAPVIVNISSVSGVRANPQGVAYGAAKAGLDNVTKTLAFDWGPAIRVVGLTVGMVLTDEGRAFYESLAADGETGDEAIDRISQIFALRRFATPADVADVALFAVSDLARYVSGTNIEVHGGGEGPSYLLASTGDVGGGPLT